MASSSAAGETNAGSSSGPRLSTYDQNSRTASIGDDASMGSATLTSHRGCGATGRESPTRPSDHAGGGPTARASGAGRRHEAPGQVVIDHAGGLHQRVRRRGADEGEAPLLQL